MYRGGGETFNLNIASGLQKLGVKVSFVTGKPLFGEVKYPITEFPAEYCSSSYIRDLALPISSMRNIHIPGPDFIIDNLDQIFFCRSCLKLLSKNQDYDILHVNRIGLIKMKTIRDTPIVIRFPGPPLLWQRKLIQRFDAVIASGDSVNFIKENIRNDVIDIPPGIDAEKFKPVNNSIRNEYLIGDADKILLFVGRFVPLKNLPFLIESFKEVIKQTEDVKLMLVGEGALEKRIKKLIENYKLQKSVIFTGKVDNKELAKYYSAADIFVLSSFYESFSFVTIEAMSCQLPIVATNVGYLPKLIKPGENGFLIESGNVQQFKDAIITLLDDESLAKEMGKRNRIKVQEKYDWVQSAKKLKGVYESLMES
ncbi:D-inositol-3-phosphate glycosyltransferase [subsurface metagenome]